MTTKDIVLVGLLAALLKASQAILSFLPNIEIVSLLILVFAIKLGAKKTIYVTTVFSVLNMLIWGINPASIGYFGVWGAFAIACSLLKGFITNEFRAALILGLFGICFGFLFVIVYLPIDKTYAITYWLNGISFDIIHAISNFIIGLWVFKPSINGFDRAYKAIYMNSNSKKNYINN